MDALISTALIDFIRLECGIGQSEVITASTGMQRDLGVYGDDAVEFLVAYGKAFQVDVSRFMAADYFDGEGMDVLAWFKPVKKRKELTVGHLQQGIVAKRLDEEVLRGT
jgi:Protein of unknown function (DUF1493)